MFQGRAAARPAPSYSWAESFDGLRRGRSSQRENLGRELFTVNFDSGEKLILFAHEIETVSDGLAA